VVLTLLCSVTLEWAWLWVLLCRFLARSGVVLLFTKKFKLQKSETDDGGFPTQPQSLPIFFSSCDGIVCKECWKLFLTALVAHKFCSLTTSSLNQHFSRCKKSRYLITEFPSRKTHLLNAITGLIVHKIKVNTFKTITSLTNRTADGNSSDLSTYQTTSAQRRCMKRWRKVHKRDTILRYCVLCTARVSW
jgi:hypothetical protein